MRGWSTVILWGIVTVAAAPADEDHALTIADLAVYRAALIDRPGSNSKSEGTPVSVGFRELWSHPETYQGRRVQVSGRVIRRFRQGAIGTFPPLAEVWAVSPSGDPFCLVYPVPTGHSAPEPTGTVRFIGTFLKQVRYQGGDGARLAPLIVGPKPPNVQKLAPLKTPIPSRSVPWLDWTIGLAAAIIVVLVLAGQHFRQPARRPLKLDNAPPPVFLDDKPPPLFDDDV